MRSLFRLAMLVVAIVLVVFAVSNRGMIALGLWPLPDVVELPLYLIILGCLLVGFLAGELAAWVSGRHWRREVRRSARRIATLERELDTVRAEREPAPAPTRLAG
jgi:uncharacterized integral membrane protein